MKKIFLLVCFLGLAGGAAFAQFSDYGVRLGLGTATIQDDLGTKSPVPALNVGGYINFELQHNQTVLAEIFYLQTGLNLIHRGSHFEEVLENENTMSIRTGHYKSWYLQLPILAGIHMELPIRQSGHVVGIVLGPAVNYGLFGSYADRKVSPGITARRDNYDVAIHGTAEEQQLFNHINRLDISAILGITYERGPLSIALMMDHGFLATSKGTDVLRLLDQQLTDNSTDINVEIPNGNNHAVMISLTWRLGSFKTTN